MKEMSDVHSVIVDLHFDIKILEETRLLGLNLLCLLAMTSVCNEALREIDNLRLSLQSFSNCQNFSVVFILVRIFIGAY